MNYSAKVTHLNKSPAHRGALFQIEADEKGVAMVDAKINSLKIYLFVDPNTDQILESKFFTYGGPIYTAIAEVLCAHLEGKNLYEAVNAGPEYFNLFLSDAEEAPLITPNNEYYEVVESLLKGLEQGLPEKKIHAQQVLEKKSRQPEKNIWEARAEHEEKWLSSSIPSRVIMVEDTLNQYIRQGLNMDGGDIEIIELDEDHKIRLRYQGACSSCGSSTGGTLFYIENKLREHCYHGLQVIPENTYLDNYTEDV